MAASLRSVEATRSSTMARLVSVKPATAGRHRLAPAPEAARGRGVVFRRIANSSRDFHEKRRTGRQVRVKQTARRLASVSTRMAAEEPRTGPKMDQKKELAKKALEQAFQGKEKEFAKLDDQGNNGSGNGRGDRGGGGGGGGGGNNGEDWGEVFEMAVKIVMYLLLGIVFVIIWPKLFDGATNVYNKMTKKEVVQSKPVKEDFDDEDFDELVRESEAKTTTTTTTTQAASTKTEAKPVKRAFPEREAFDTWQFGAVKGQDAQDELVEKEIQEQTLQEEMLNPGAGFHDQFQAKPRSKHIVLKDTKTMDKPGPYQDYVTGKWK